MINSDLTGFPEVGNPHLAYRVCYITYFKCTTTESNDWNNGSTKKEKLRKRKGKKRLIIMRRNLTEPNTQREQKDKLSQVAICELLKTRNGP